MSFKTSLSLYTLCVIVCFIILNLWFEHNRKAKKLSAAVVFSSFWAVAGGGFILLSILFSASDEHHLVQNALASLAGAGLGWLLGMYISPIGTSEATSFQKYGTALAGVLSGYTLASALDIAKRHQPLLLSHSVPIALFSISLLLAVAVVYNSRAYDNKILEIHVDGTEPDLSNGMLQLAVSTQTTFFAQVVGPVNPSVRWSLEPLDSSPGANLPAITQAGLLTATANAAKCRLIAVSLEDASLSNSVDLNIK